MKKCLIAMVLLLGLVLGGLCAAHSQLKASGSAVTLTEDSFAGDRSAAAGLHVDLIRTDRRHLQWETTFVPASGDTETQFTFFPDRLPYHSFPRTGLNLQAETLHLTISGDSITFPLGEGILDPFIEAVAGRTQADQTRTETVKLADHFPFFPLQANLSLRKPGSEAWQTWSWSELRQLQRRGDDTSRYQFLQDLAAAFPFPTPKELHVDISVSKNSAGRVTDLNCQPSKGKVGQVSTVPYAPDSDTVCQADPLDNVEIYSWSVQTDNALFFLPYAAKESDRSLLDYSHTPGGYGLYYLPLSWEEGWEEHPLSMDTLKLALPLDAQTCPLALQLDHSGQRLLLLIERDGQNVLLVLDAADGSLLQTLPLQTASTENNWVHVTPFDGFLLLDGPNGQFQVLTWVDGAYTVQLEGTYPPPETLPVQPTDFQTAAFDGHRLALAYPEYHNLYEGCGFHLLVLDGSGLQYAGTFRSSLDDDRPAARNLGIGPSPAHLALRWTPAA